MVDDGFRFLMTKCLSKPIYPVLRRCDCQYSLSRPRSSVSQATEEDERFAAAGAIVSQTFKTNKVEASLISESIRHDVAL
jgi:hypothetical protein